jgi:hypothetical protein
MVKLSSAFHRVAIEHTVLHRPTVQAILREFGLVLPRVRRGAQKGFPKSIVELKVDGPFQRVVA